MTFVLFSQVTMLGELSGPGGGQPVIDPSGEPVAEQGDGPAPLHQHLVSASAGYLMAPDDAGRATFSSTGLAVELTCTDTRLVFLAHSEAAGQWVGQLPYRLITDVFVGARSTRRDPGSVRVLFLEPGGGSATDRQFVDLVPARKMAPDDLAWLLVDRAARDRHRWIAPEAVADHQRVETLRGRGPASAYWLPAATSTTAAESTPAQASAIERTVRLASAAVGTSAPLDRSPWAPPLEATELRPVGTPLPIDGMIMSVPGVTPKGQDPSPTAGWVDEPVGAVLRIELDTGATLTVAGPTLLGRDPAALSGETVALQAISDPSFSYSKTHLLLAPGGDQVSVTDRHSTNGVIAEQAGQTRACPPGVPVEFQLPVTLRIGRRWLSVTRTS